MYSKSAARITSGITKCNHMPLFGERASMGESVLHDWMDLGIGYVELWNCFFFFWWCDHLVTRLQDKPKLRLYGYIASDSLSFWEQQLVTAFAYTHNCVTFFHSLSKQCNGSEAGRLDNATQTEAVRRVNSGPLTHCQQLYENHISFGLCVRAQLFYFLLLSFKAM